MSHVDGLDQQIEAELLDPLNPIQREAVLHNEGPLLIVAGAGSGKTRVITHRIAYLARLRKIAPWNICAVTFTNKAAGEMQTRLTRVMGPMAGKVFVRTFHSLGLYVLTRNPETAGLRSGFTIYDNQAQGVLLKKIIKDFKLSGDALTPRSVSHRIGMARDQMLDPDRFAETSNDFYTEDIARIYKEYIKRLREMNALDFGDLLFETARLFLKNPEVLANYQNLWKYFMIDEYQDTNHVQYVIGRLIARDHKNIMVVGDDDQSIYSWRGADISNILNFEKDYGKAKVLKLEENYRSSANILNAAGSVIANNRVRRKKNLFTSRDDGLQVTYTEYDDDLGEATQIVARIQNLKRQGIPYKEMAVFYRTNAQSRPFESVLRSERIPYVLVGDIRFYERKEIKDLLAYLNVLVNPADEISLERILNVPARGVGATGLQKLRDLAMDKGFGLLDALPYAGDLPRFRSAAKMKQLADQIQRWQSMLRRSELPSIITSAVLEESGYLEMLKKDTSPEAPGRIENLYEFLASIQEYEQNFQPAPAEILDAFVPVGIKKPVNLDQESEHNQGQLEALLDKENKQVQIGHTEMLPMALSPGLLDFLQKVSLYTTREGEQGGDGTPDDFLFLMTLHNAKGLEYPYVFIAGTEEGFLPHIMSIDEGNEEEERRLMYVGITRAMEQLFISMARRRRIQGTYQDRMPSRFINEVDAELWQPGQAPGNHRPAFPNSSPRAGAGRGQIHWQKPTDSRDLEEYTVGERIQHTKHGNGTVLHVEITVAGPKLAIQFDHEERIRNFLVAYAPLSRLT